MREIDVRSQKKEFLEELISKKRRLADRARAQIMTYQP
jgi:predicted P-loop ATPase/GTPase